MDVETTEVIDMANAKRVFSGKLYLGQEMEVRAALRVCGAACCRWFC